MQHNPSDTTATSCRSPESASHQQISNTTNIFPRGTCNPRFCITPESMGMNLPLDNPSSTRKQAQDDTPLVDVKPYYERHNKSHLMGVQSASNQESNVSFPNSYGALKCDNVCQRRHTIETQSSIPSPNIFTSTQQSNLDNPGFEKQHKLYNSEASLSHTQSTQPNLTYPSCSTIFMQSIMGEPPSSANDIQPKCVCLQNIISNTGIPLTAYEQQQVQNYRTDSCDSIENSAKKNYNILSELYSKRIEDIDANVWGDKDLKIATYQEWVEVLTKINKSFIINMEELEKEVSARLELFQRNANSNCRHSQGNELMKCRKDIASLLKYIKKARYSNNWDLQDFTFETIKTSQLFEAVDFEHLGIDSQGGDAMKNSNNAEVMQANKLYANMKALALEVAEKHDEVRDLKRQIICMEDEIQNAQKKIQLKDGVIKELRNDLKCANNKFSAQDAVDTSLTMPPINFGEQTSRSDNTQNTECITPNLHDDNGSQFDSLSLAELEEQQKQKQKVLKEEINEFFEINTANKQKMESQRQRLWEIFKKMEAEKADVYRKLYFLRRQLIDLESDTTEGSNDSDSGFHSKSENDQDAKIIDAVRKRLRKLTETNGSLKKTVHKLELERSELSNNLLSEKTFSKRNEEILREIADLLSGMNCKQFSYTDVYNTNPCNLNPFCDAIMAMKKDFQEKEAQLLKAVGMRSQQIEELSKTLKKNETDFNEERGKRLTSEDIGKTITLHSTATSSQSPQQRVTIFTTISTPLTISSPTTKSSTSVPGQELETTIKTESLPGCIGK